MTMIQSLLDAYGIRAYSKLDALGIPINEPKYSWGFNSKDQEALTRLESHACTAILAAETYNLVALNRGLEDFIGSDNVYPDVGNRNPVLREIEISGIRIGYEKDTSILSYEIQFFHRGQGHTLQVNFNAKARNSFSSPTERAHYLFDGKEVLAPYKMGTQTRPNALQLAIRYGLEDK